MVTAFSVAVGEIYAAELAKKIYRCRMNAQAKRSDIKDFARYAIESYLVEKNRDWTPLPAVEGRGDAPGEQ
jgi:hypothetical protein